MDYLHSLPKEIAHWIAEFSSDLYSPTPSAECMKDCAFGYAEERNIGGIWNPECKIVVGPLTKRVHKCANVHCFVCAVPTWSCDLARPCNRMVIVRHYVLSDFG